MTSSAKGRAAVDAPRQTRRRLELDKTHVERTFPGNAAAAQATDGGLAVCLVVVP